jgi:hypothetical protein
MKQVETLIIRLFNELKLLGGFLFVLRVFKISRAGFCGEIL